MEQRSFHHLKSTSLLGHVDLLRGDQLKFAQLLSSKGDVVRFRIGTRVIHFLNHPDDVHRVLVTDADHYNKGPAYRILLGRFLGRGLLTSEGDFWKRQRKLMQPMFHSKYLQNYAETMYSDTRDLLARWSTNQTRDINDDMMRLTLRIVARTLFTADVDADASRIGHALTEVLESSDQTLRSPFWLPMWIPTPLNVRTKRAVEQLDEIIHRIIAERRANPNDGTDLLSMLIAAQDEDGTTMTDQQIRDEAVTIFLAGHETTANALTWTFYLLAKHPQIEAQLHEEVARVVGDGPVTVEHVRQLPYTEMVLKESMRLYPPIPTVARAPKHPVEIGGVQLGYKDRVMITPYTLHHDPRWWDAPQEFRPDRWRKDNEQAINKRAYWPFGGGPRICIGNNFAMMEATIILATIAARYRLALTESAPIIPVPTLTLRPDRAVLMRPVLRQAARIGAAD
jgi:cytochrome P450